MTSKPDEDVPDSLLDSRYDLCRFNDDSFSALGIRTGAYALVRHRPVVSGTLAAVMTPDCGPVLRIVFFEDQAMRLRALNPLFRDLWYSPARVSIIGAVEKVFPQNKNTIHFPSGIPAQRQPLVGWTADERGRVTDISEMLGLAAGHDRREFLQDGWRRFVHPDERQGIVNAWHRSIENGEPFNERFRFRSLLGDYMQVHSRGRPVLFSPGRLERWEGSLMISAPTTDGLTGRFYYPKKVAS